MHLTMEADDDEESEHAGGSDEDDVDDNMMESMFELCAYVENNNDDEDDSDDENNLNLNATRQSANQAGWTYLTTGEDLSVTISIDGVDQRLLAKAREEVPAVLDKIKRKLFGKRKRDMSKVSPADFLKAFMDPHLLGYMKAFINSNDSGNNPVTSTEVMAFVRVELMLSFYKVWRYDVLLMVVKSLVFRHSNLCLPHLPGISCNVL
jgi:hypothetical protein